jgi:hypothetical protein
MDTTVGKEVWNFPIYSFGTWSEKQGEKQVEVKTTIAFVNSIERESHTSPLNRRTMYFHYILDLNDEGKIVGGRYLGDSNRIDMLWAPLKPIQGGQKGNELGNPYLNVKEVLAIWRASVPEEARANWLNIDPTEEDRIPAAEPAAETTVAEAPAADVTPEDAPAERDLPELPATETPVDEPEVAVTEAVAEPAVTESSAEEASETPAVEPAAATPVEAGTADEPAAATP